MVQFFKSSHVALSRAKNYNTTEVSKGINWIVENTESKNQWEAILLLSYLTKIDKNYIERKVRKKREETGN